MKNTLQRNDDKTWKRKTNEMDAMKTQKDTKEPTEMPRTKIDGTNAEQNKTKHERNATSTQDGNNGDVSCTPRSERDAPRDEDANEPRLPRPRDPHLAPQLQMDTRPTTPAHVLQ